MILCFIHFLVQLRHMWLYIGYSGHAHRGHMFISFIAIILAGPRASNHGFGHMHLVLYTCHKYSQGRFSAIEVIDSLSG